MRVPILQSSVSFFHYVWHSPQSLWLQRRHIQYESIDEYEGAPVRQFESKNWCIYEIEQGIFLPLSDPSTPNEAQHTTRIARSTESTWF